MSFVNDREDINSISLTCVNNLMAKNNISKSEIGRLEVGTETVIDKSKSIKTTLMGLFQGCHDIEGVTSINACYGGTNALFNSFNWVESNAWDGRKAIVVMSDIAVYKKGPARPTGGAGCICFLIGPDAPITIEPVRASFVDHQYDFYKPDAGSKYPTVDGQISISIYLNALRQTMSTFETKYVTRYGASKKVPSYYDFSYFCFHTPYSKMVQKSFF